VNPEDKARLARKVPPVLNALREGLALIEWPQSKAQEFFARLLNSHAQAVKALELAHGTQAPFVPSTLGIKLDAVTMSVAEPANADADEGQELPVSDEAVEQMLAAKKVGVNHLAAPAEPQLDESAADADPDRRIEALRRGDWVDLKNGDRVDRVQLRWLSPRRALYMFASAQDDKIFSMKPATLRALMRDGRIAPVESEHMFDRALRATMDALEQTSAEAATAA
jgi:hypothetical protein